MTMASGSTPAFGFVPPWPVHPAVRAFVTVRGGGASGDPFASFNLGDHVGDAPQAVAANRAALRATLPAEPLWLEQVHGADVADADAASGVPRADAAVARRAGVVCAILTADCLPVLYAADDGSVVAAAHAGWRGLAAGVLEATVAAMAVPPEDVVAWLGPAIGPAAFEVGADVHAAFCATDGACGAFFAPLREGKWLADLPGLARHRLARLRIGAAGGTWCTHTEADRFFSWRRDKASGRMALVAWLATDQ